jgi:hypothetical protein
MTQVKSPFLVIPEFVSPLMCEEIVDALDFTVADTDKKGVPISSTRSNPEYEEYLYTEFLKYVRDIEIHYNVTHQATCQTFFEIYPEGSRGKLTCDNAAYLNEKWVRVKDRDLTCVVFFTDYNDSPDFDDTYEVYGGKLEFPQHGFGFNPQRGTMVVFPSVPQFINTVTPIQAGDLFTARFHIKTTVPFLYDPTQFPGDYRTWFREIV